MDRMMFLGITLAFCLLICCATFAQVLRNDADYIACPQHSITKSSGIASPLFPEYAPNFYCEYNFQAPKDRYVVIKFDQFVFPPRSKARRGINYEKVYPRCLDDFVEISDDQKYITKFRYCGNELQGKEFRSRGRSVKLILQTKARNFVGGFKGNVTFPLRKKTESSVTCAKSPDTGADLQRCTAPLHRVMTPESSVHLTVTKKGVRGCSVNVSMTAEYQEVVPYRQSEDHVMLLDSVHEICRFRGQYPAVHHITVPNTLVYEVLTKQQKTFEVMLKEFSTKQRRMCGGHVTLNTSVPFTISYSNDLQRKYTCLWVIHGGPMDNSIHVKISKFRHNGENKNCENHHLSTMFVGPNMFELLRDELEKDSNKFKRSCATSTSDLVYQRRNRDVYGRVSLMVMLSHSKTFRDFRIDFKSSTDSDWIPYQG